MKNTIAAVSLFLLVACSQGPAPADPSAISSNSEAWQAAMNAKDIDAIAAMYTEDARIMPPNGAAKIGRDAVREEFGAMIDAGLSVQLDVIETGIGGDVGYNIGTYVLTAGDEEIDRGKYIETWKRSNDGEWRMANDIWNSDVPLPQPGDNDHLVILHEVDDAQHWLDAWRGENSRRELFKANGADHVHTFVAGDRPNLTGLVISVSDMDALGAMMESEEGQAAAAEDGVRWDTLLVLTEVR